MKNELLEPLSLLMPKVNEDLINTDSGEVLIEWTLTYVSMLVAI